MRKWPGLWILSGAFGMLNAAGQWMYRLDRLPDTGTEHLAFWGQALGEAALFFLVALLLIRFGPRLLRKSEASEEAKKHTAGIWAALAFVIILAGWLPWLLSYYPCSADYDVYKPITQYLGLAEKTNAFPWFYCTTVGFFYNLGLGWGEKNAGMFLYVLLRAVCMSAVYAYLVSRLEKRGIRKPVLALIILFYAIVPVWGAYAKHAFKDTQAAAFFCWFITLTAETTTAIRQEKEDKKLFLFCSLSALLMSFYRHNLFFVAIPVILLLVISILKRKGFPHKARAGSFLLAGLILFGGYQVYITAVEKVGPAKAVDALSIPFQQTARTLRDHREKISEEEMEAIRGVLDPDRIGAVYDPLISDRVKDTAHDLAENGNTYALTWFRMGFRFPKAYMEALIGQNYGYYAFTGDQVGHAGNWNCGMTIFDWVKDPRYDDSFTCDYREGTEGIRKALDDWAKTWHGIPVLNLTDMEPLYTWLILLAGCLLIHRKRWLEMIPILGMVLEILFCCGSPVNDSFRYFAPVAAAAPAVLLFHSKKKQEC